MEIKEIIFWLEIIALCIVFVAMIVLILINIVFHKKGGALDD